MNMNDVAERLRALAVMANGHDVQLLLALAHVFGSAENIRQAGNILASAAGKGAEIHDAALPLADLIGE